MQLDHSDDLLWTAALFRRFGFTFFRRREEIAQHKLVRESIGEDPKTKAAEERRSPR
jgi:hypothetical protein